MKDLPEIMSLNDAAVFLNTSKRALLEFHKSGLLAGVKFDETFCFRTKDLLKLGHATIDRPMSERQDAATSRIERILPPERILIHEKTNKKELLLDLLNLIASSPGVLSREELESGIFKREELMSTGLGMGIAIPHVRLSSVLDIHMSAALVRGGVDNYEALDGVPVNLVFMIAARPDQHANHLQIVSQLSLKLKEESIRSRLLNAANPEEFIQILTCTMEKKCANA